MMSWCCALILYPGYASKDVAWYHRTHRRIAYAVVVHLNGPYLQRLRINAQMHLTPLAAILGAVLFAFPFALTQELDAGAVNQQMLPLTAALVVELYGKTLVAAADGAVVGHRPVNT